MKKSLRISIVALVLLLSACSAFSQSVTFNRVVSPIGSLAGSVGGITQDKNGYMWFATGGGLYRYDGYRFKLFANDPSDPSSIAATRLETIYADRQGMIWIGTWVDGLDRFDPKTGVFTHFRHHPRNRDSLSNDTVRAILEDRDGALWVGTSGGVDRYDPKTNRFQNYHTISGDPASLSCNRVRVLYEDKAGTIWIGTGSAWDIEGGETDEGGLNSFDKKTGRFTRYRHDPANPQSLINNKVNAIYEDSRGTFWVGTAGDGLHTMDRSTGTFERHRYDQAHPERLSRPPLNKSGIDYISFINEDATGNIWIGTIAGGINRYDPKTDRVVHYGRKDTALGFTENSGWCFCNSKDGMVWIGCFQNGLYRVNPFHKNIPYFPVAGGALAFENDSSGRLWIGTNQGLLLQKEHGVLKKFSHDPLDPFSLSNNAITSLFRDGEDVLWVGTINGLNAFRASENRFVRYQHNPKVATTIDSGLVVAIADAGPDSLWIATNHGLDLMDKRTSVFTHFKSNLKDSNSLFNGFVTSVLTDSRGNLWIGSYGLGSSLLFFDRSRRTFRRFLKGIFVTSLLMDSQGTLWVGTDAGIFKTADPNAGFTKFTDPGSGVEITSAGTMQEDNRKNIWVCDFSGIYKINIKTGQTTIFGTDYGFKKDAYYWSGHKGPQGEIYFGHEAGYYTVLPDHLLANATPPQIALTNFRVGGKAIPAQDSYSLSYAFDTGKEITLGHDQNIFSFDLAAIHYSSPEYNRLLYRLQNYDATWRDARYEKTASYYNVPPGRYMLNIKAASSEGMWTERSIAITIRPPWWRTWWAYGLYGLLFVGLVYAVHRFQKQRVIAAERERTRVRELAQAKEIEKAYQELKATQVQLIQSEKMASLGELTAGIAHEIQNPLNFVNNFSEVNTELVKELEQELQNGDADTAKAIASNIKENEEKISYHGRRADAIVKSMLQHSRTSTGQKEPTDINALTDEYLRLSYHGLRAKDKAFNATLKTHFDERIGNVNVVPQDIGRVLLNLFNNAFYAVSEKKKQASEDYEPTVTVSTKKLPDKVEISVEDNGMGISKSLQEKIFQPFFTTKPAGQGTGLGLSLSYDIVKAHHGEFLVTSEEGVGTSFLVVLKS